MEDERKGDGGRNETKKKKKRKALGHASNTNTLAMPQQLDRPKFDNHSARQLVRQPLQAPLKSESKWIKKDNGNFTRWCFSCNFLRLPRMLRGCMWNKSL